MAAQAQALASRQGQDFVRALAGLLFTAGALALFIRKSNAATGDTWGDFPLLLTVLIPAALLYWLAVVRDEGGEEPAAWQTVYLVFAVVLSPVVLFRFFDWIGASTDDSLLQTLIFLLVAAVAGYAAMLRVNYGAFLAAVALLFAWLSFWDKVADPSASGNRWLLVIVALIFVAASVGMRAGAERQSRELVTAAGIAAVIAGMIGIGGELVGLAAGAFAGAFGAGISPDAIGAGQDFFWDLVLLVVALALILFGARASSRGPVYVGAVALLLFLASVGFQITDLVEGEASGKLAGWPLALLIVGGAGIVAGFFAAGMGGGMRPAAAGPSPPPQESVPPAGGAPPPAGPPPPGPPSGPPSPGPPQP